MHRIKEMSIYHGESRVFYIDSSNRTSGTDSNFQINVNLPKNNFNRVALLQLSCPKSFYNFSTDKNTFTLYTHPKRTWSRRYDYNSHR